MNSTPNVSFNIPKNKFTSLLRCLRAAMNDHLDNLDRNDSEEVRLFEMNYWLLISWIALEDDKRDKTNIKVKVDLMYAKAFLEYWRPVALPIYEEVLLRKVMVDIDSSITHTALKRRFINL